MYEMKSLTLNDKKYDSFVDQEAREAIEEIERNGVGGNAPKITLEDVHDVSKGDGVKITVESGSIEDGSYNEQSETVWNGRNGTSAYASVTTEDDGTVVITTKDASGNQTASVKSGKDGKDGQDGYTPVKGIDYFDGKDGEDGADGVSPTVSVSKSGKVTSITITDKNGTKTATINDGADGSNGSNGKDGTSVTVKSVSESTADGGSNVVTFSDGKTVSIKNGAKGGDYVLTEDDRQEIAALAAELVEVPKGDSNVTDTIPSYWKTALDNGVEAINTALCEAGRNKSSFLFYSDAHWNAGSQMSPTLLKYLYNHTGMTKTFYGGDIVNDEASDYDTMEYLWKWRNQLKGLPNHHSVVGNHDDGNTTNNLFSEQYIYGYLLAAEETCDMVVGDGIYYYIDNATEKTRYICLDTAYKTSTADQSVMRDFLADALKSTPNNWHIVVVSHIWYMPDYNQYDVRPIPIIGLSTEASAVCSVLDNYNARSGEFADCNAKVEFCIGGHVHRDYVGTTNGGIPIIIVETDSRHIRSNFSYNVNTTDESSVNGVVANYDKNELNVIRIGRGSSFIVDLATGDNVEIPDNGDDSGGSTKPEIPEGNYINRLPESLTLDGTGIFGGDYNGDGTPDGYVRNMRTSSSGDTSSGGAGWCISGLIPAKPGNIIRFYNMEYYDISGDGGSTPRTTFFVYDAAFNKLTNASHNPSNPPESKFNAVFGDNGDVIQLTAPSGWGDYEYIRICCGDLNEHSIITVTDENGGGGSSTTSYENKLETAIGFDGTWLDSQGYRDGVRLSTSSNAYSPVEGYDCTGMIRAKQGDIIRLKNVSFKVDTADYPRVSYRKVNYDTITQTKLKDAVDNLSPVYDDSGNIVQFTIPTWSSLDEIEYIIICAQDINASSIITINESITD